MQTLHIKVKGPDGSVSKRTIQVVRTWVEGGGRALYLHGNGIYGYVDGAPVKSRADLSVIGDAVQRRLAEQWWQAAGARLSAQFYNAQEQQLEKLAQRGMASVTASEQAAADQVLYRRRPIKNRSRSAFCDPANWQQFFDQRPDWWGAAAVIEIGDWRYERLDQEDFEPEAEAAPGPAEIEPSGGSRTAPTRTSPAAEPDL